MVWVLWCGCEYCAYIENKMFTVKHPWCSVESKRPSRTVSNGAPVRSFTMSKHCKLDQKKATWQSKQSWWEWGKKNIDHRVQSGYADISCGSLTLHCGLHKFHSELLSVKLMKLQAVQQKKYPSVVSHWVNETCTYHRYASSHQRLGAEFA